VWCAASGPVCGVGFVRFFASFLYKLVVWVFEYVPNIPMYRFSASFPYKLVTSLFLNEKAELLPVALKKLDATK
jgi:hypothetical protein